MVKVFVPADTTSCALGADEVASRIAKHSAEAGLEIELVRNGSRGAFWLEPLLEVETHGRRIAYGPVMPDDVASLFEAGFPGESDHPLYLGDVSDI